MGGGGHFRPEAAAQVHGHRKSWVLISKVESSLLSTYRMVTRPCIASNQYAVQGGEIGSSRIGIITETSGTARWCGGRKGYIMINYKRTRK